MRCNHHPASSKRDHNIISMSGNELLAISLQLEWSHCWQSAACAVFSLFLFFLFFPKACFHSWVQKSFLSVCMSVFGLWWLKKKLNLSRGDMNKKNKRCMFSQFFIKMHEVKPDIFDGINTLDAAFCITGLLKYRKKCIKSIIYLYFVFYSLLLLLF